VPFLGWHLRRAGHLPVVREDVRASVRNIAEAAQRVAGGVSVVVFPEGARSPDGSIGEFRAGAAHIAIKARAPLTPVCILGTRQIHTQGSLIVRPGKAELRIGRPIPTIGLANRDARRLMAQAREQVGELSGARRLAASGCEVVSD
jgi:1-acyl-sn-glycerol-3-phosphate acyltransferase